MTTKLTTNDLRSAQRDATYLVAGRLWRMADLACVPGGGVSVLFLPMVSDRDPLEVRVAEDQLDWLLWEPFSA